MFVFQWNGYTGQLNMRISRYFVEGYSDARYFSLNRAKAEKIFEATGTLITEGTGTETDCFESEIWNIIEGTSEHSGLIYTPAFVRYLEILGENVPKTRLQNQVIKGSVPMI